MIGALTGQITTYNSGDYAARRVDMSNENINPTIIESMVPIALLIDKAEPIRITRDPMDDPEYLLSLLRGKLTRLPWTDFEGMRKDCQAYRCTYEAMEHLRQDVFRMIEDIDIALAMFRREEE